MSLRSKLAAPLLALISTVMFAATAVAKPNIVFVLVDDLDYAVWKAALDAKDNTTQQDILPTIKTRLMNRATEFQQMFVSQSLCCPSRATLHTGRYPQNHKVVGNHLVYQPFKANMEPQALATWVGGAGGQGYRTGYIGKYLNESGAEGNYVPPGWDVWRALVVGGSGHPESNTQCMYGFSLANSGSRKEFFGDPDHPENEELYQTNVMARAAVDFINTSGDTPFMLMIAPMAPHAEACSPTYASKNGVQVRTSPKYVGKTDRIALPTRNVASSNEEDMSDKPLWMRGLKKKNLDDREDLFNEKVNALRPVDDLVKTVIDALGSKYDNTLFVFTSDNGYQYGTHRLAAKQDLYEESIHVPMVIKAPFQTQKKVSQDWVMNNDWAPTVATYAGVTEQTLLEKMVDGRSLMPLLDGTATNWPRKTIMVQSGWDPDAASTKGLFKSEDAGTDNEHIPFVMVRTRNPSLTNDPTGNKVMVYAETYDPNDIVDTPTPGVSRELYDLSVNEGLQTNSLHRNSARAGQMAKLKTKLDAMKYCKVTGGVNTCRNLEDN